MQVTTHFHGVQAQALFGAYAYAFREHFGKHTQPSEQITGITGRILRGKTDADFQTLTDNPVRKVIFLVDERALNGFIGLSGRELLESIGYPERFIAELLAQGTMFRLVVFSKQETKLATWENLLEVVRQAYPEMAEKISEALPLLKTLTYEQLQAAGGVPYGVRCFLEQTVNVNRLYTGDGYILNEKNNGSARDAEYVALNQPLDNFADYCLISFPVR